MSRAQTASPGPGHRGHGPQWNLTRRAGGKTVNVHLKPWPELEKARAEVAEHQRFAALVAEVSQVSEAICAARPVAGQAVPLRRRGKGGLTAQLAEIAAGEIGGLAALADGVCVTFRSRLTPAAVHVTYILLSSNHDLQR